MKEHSLVHKKPASIRVDKRNWARHILPKLGHRKVGDISRTDIHELHSSLASTPGAATSVRATLSKAFNLADRDQLSPSRSRTATSDCQAVSQSKNAHPAAQRAKKPAWSHP